MIPSYLCSSTIGLCFGSFSYLAFATHSFHQTSKKIIHLTHPLLNRLSKGYALPKALVFSATLLVAQMGVHHIETTLLIPAFLSHMIGMLFFTGPGFILTHSFFNHFPLPDKNVNEALDFLDRYLISPPLNMINCAEVKIKDFLTPQDYTD